MKKILFLLVSILLLAQLGSALFVKSVDAPTIAPGQEGRLSITVENTLNDDVENLIVSLDFANLPLSPVGSSADVIEEINEDDDESVSFLIRSDSNAQVGDYKLPYKLSYGNGSLIQQGSVGIRISALPQLSTSISIDNPVVDQQAKVTLRIVNKGLGEARFVSVKINPSGFTLLSEDTQYIGSIDSDDFETSSFDVKFTSRNAFLTGVIEYRDIDNKLLTMPLNIPLQVYSLEQAQELGIVKKSNAGMIIGLVVIILVIWLVYRSYKKRQRMRRSMQMQNGN